MNPTRIREAWGAGYSNSPFDMLGVEFNVGDVYVKSYSRGNSTFLEICTVTRIEDGKIYGNGSHVNVKYPGRCLIVPKEYGKT